MTPGPSDPDYWDHPDDRHLPFPFDSDVPGQMASGDGAG